MTKESTGEHKLASAEGNGNGEARSGTQVVSTAGVIGLLLFLRILAVSHWRWSVASKVTETFEFSDAPAIALGTLFEWPMLTAVLSCIVAPIVFLKFYMLRRMPKNSEVLAWGLVVATICATLAVLVRTFAMWWTIIVIVVLTILLIAAAMVYHRGWLHTLVDFIRHSAGVVAITGLLILAVVVDKPWMPAEEVTLRTGEVVNAYVLEDAPGFMTVLTEEHRNILILNESEIKSRE